MDTSSTSSKQAPDPAPTLDEVRERQAAMIGRCAMIGSYRPTLDASIDGPYLVDSYEELALITRRLCIHDMIAGDLPRGSFSDKLSHVQRQNILFIGAVAVTRAITETRENLRKISSCSLLALHGSVIAAEGNYENARRVQSRRELTRAVESNLSLAKERGVTPLEALTLGLGKRAVEQFDMSCRATHAAGVKLGFINRQREQLGLPKMKADRSEGGS